MERYARCRRILWAWKAYLKSSFLKKRLKYMNGILHIGGENIEKANKANVGITISEISLAESGTVVVFSGKDHGRTVNFLPEYSIILVPKSSIST